MWASSFRPTTGPSSAAATDGLVTSVVSCYRWVSDLTLPEALLHDALCGAGALSVTSHPFKVLEGVCCRFRHDPEKSSRRKVEMRNLIKQLGAGLCGNSGEDVLFSLPRVSGSVVGLVYGPRAGSLIATASHDTLTLVGLKDELRATAVSSSLPLVLESIDRVRVLLIDCDRRPLESHHREQIFKFLCDGTVKRDLYPVERGAAAVPPADGTSGARCPAVKDDQVAAYVCGAPLVSGRGNDFFNNLGPGLTYEDPTSRKICVPVSHEWWGLRCDALGTTPSLALDFFTHIRPVTRFGNQDARSVSQLGQVYYLDSVVADHVCCLGRVYPGHRDASRYLSHRQGQLARLRLSRDLSVVGNSGCPLAQGFVRFLGLWDDEAALVSPVVTYESYLLAERATLRSVTGDRPALCPDLLGGRAEIFALGNFYLGDPSLQLEFSHFESGRDLCGVRSTLTHFLGGIDNRLVAGISNAASSSNLQKLASLSGASGVVVSPEFAATLGKIPGVAGRSRDIRGNVSSPPSPKAFLAASHPVVYVAIHSCPHMMTDSILSEVAAYFQCLCTYVGYLDDRVDGVVFKTVPGPGEVEGATVASFRKNKRRYHLPLAESPGVPPTAPGPVADEGELQDALLAVLRHPSVGSKDYICKHTDRVSTGQVIRNPGVGPYDVPVGDYLALCHKLTPFDLFDLACWDRDTPGVGARKVFSEHPLAGFCSAVGERTQLFWDRPHLGVKVAITEALLNLCGANVGTLATVVVAVQFTWPHVAGFQAQLDAVMRSAADFAADLGVSFYVEGANSSTMGLEGAVAAECVCVKSCVARASAPSRDVSKGLTPALVMNESSLLLISVSDGQLYPATICREVGYSSSFTEESDLRASSVSSLFSLVLALRERHLIWAVHDVSDGGVWCTLCEMAIAGGKSLEISVSRSLDVRQFLTSETPGVVVEVSRACVSTVMNMADTVGLQAVQVAVTCPMPEGGHRLTVTWGDTQLLSLPMREVYGAWSEFSSHYLAGEFQQPALVPMDQPFCNFHQPTFTPFCLTLSPAGFLKVWVLTLPGTVQPTALMAALVQSGFTPLHVPLSTVAEVDCATDVAGLCICGHTGAADPVLGEKALTFVASHTGVLKHGFEFVINDRRIWSLSLGAAACEMMAGLRAFGYNSPSKTSVFCVENASGLFESRWLNFHIPHNTKAIALRSLRGSLLPCWIQGSRLGFSHKNALIFDWMKTVGQVAAQFWGSKGLDGEALSYPRNPTAGPTSLAGLCSYDGRHLGLLFDPSLAYHLGQWSYVPYDAENLTASPWKSLFYDLYEFSANGAPAPVLSRAEDPVYSRPLP